MAKMIIKFSEMKLQLDFYLSRQNYGNYVTAV